MTHSEAAESALLARLLVDPRTVPTLRIEPEDFSQRFNRDCFRAMRRLVASGRTVDVVTLRDEGVDASLLLDITPAHRADVEEYAVIIREAALRRNYISTLQGLIERAEHDEPSELVTALEDAAAELAAHVEPDATAGRVRLAEYTHEPPPPILGVMSPAGTTILYGDGGDGKGWVACRWISQLVAEGRRVAVVDHEMQPQEFGYRLAKFGVDLDDVLYFAPPVTFDQWATREMAQLLHAERVEMLFVDSAMYAANVEDPYSPNGALAYGRGRRRLNNVPAVLLAHVTGNQDRIFGSQFWKNEARVVWRLQKDFVSRRRTLLCRKANGYPALEGRELTIHFDEPSGTLELV